MGTTLENGVYLPSEGERNCYAGLKTNWEILDQKVADVTALQQAVAGALHREIVASLPTTDIDPNTIYMILSGTSATENVYNEYMYVNNAWELIGTSATDLTNYYTKGEVDGLLLLKANVSDLTSHTGDTTIHVTTADKNKWNNGVSQSYVLRYSSSSVTDNSTIAYSTLDNTDNIKLGDKVIDVDGKIFSIVSVDTANQTVTVGSALIDLAQDSDVVHKSGDETIAGVKTFDSNTYIYNSDNTATTPTLFLKNSKTSKGSTSETGSQLLKFIDKNNNGLCDLESIATSTGACELRLRSNTLDYNNQNVQTGVTLISSPNGGKNFCPTSNNDVFLGASTLKWSRVYATNYYYGANNVEFSTKFVTTDTAQSITAVKTITDANLELKSTSAEYGVSAGDSSIIFKDKNNRQTFKIYSRVFFSGVDNNLVSFYITQKVDNTYYTSNGIQLYTNTGNKNLMLRPILANNNADGLSVSLGTSDRKWSDVQTYKVNALEPSSLSLPSGTFNDAIDISSYLVNLDGTTNTYTAPANGWISITLTNCSGIQAYITGLWGHQVIRPTVGVIRFLMPILKNQTVAIWIWGGSIDNARFIPCQGNV